ncbi:hypothetical protein D9753_01755 [Streptomyces dangxiongensis]|uniref:Uncharacterized protein n=1 Tax=Streptomyces dangxiongensis TaxID=1442032 RepID=A0A3G2J6R1_9ACTN|nr:hypothetical protein D9753_01755 [Streptomyces dangxiongensis]
MVAGLGDEESWLPTGCTGRAVRDLVFQCLQDAQRALVALHTPSPSTPASYAAGTWRRRRRTGSRCSGETPPAHRPHTQHGETRARPLRGAGARVALMETCAS